MLMSNRSNGLGVEARYIACVPRERLRTPPASNDKLLDFGVWGSLGSGIGSQRSGRRNTDCRKQHAGCHPWLSQSHHFTLGKARSL
jgi:hypothetical protein